MGAEEVVGGRTEPVASGRLRNRLRPSRGERSVELLGAAMDLAGALGSTQEPPRRLVRRMAPMQHPGDAKVIPMAHSARKHGPGLPGVHQLVIRHQGKASQESPKMRASDGYVAAPPATNGSGSNVEDRHDHRQALAGGASVRFDAVVPHRGFTAAAGIGSQPPCRVLATLHSGARPWAFSARSAA